MAAWVPVVSGGAFLFLVLCFQIAVGKRWIKLGKSHLKVHRWVAYAMLGFAAVHGTVALFYAGALRLP